MTERRAGNSRLVYDKATRTIVPERTQADYSREFAGYMATAAEAYVEASSRVEADHDEIADTFKGLLSAIYEWRKREARAQTEHDLQNVHDGKGSI